MELDRSDPTRTAPGARPSWNMRAVVLFVIMLAITLVQLRYQERRVHYGG